MIELEIDGVGTVEVDESFNDLTTRQKQEYVNRIANERKSVDGKKKRKGSDDGYLTNLARTGLGQGLLLGFGDEIEAGLRTGFGLLGDYDKTVTNVRENVKDFAEENPATALAAEIGGGLVTGGLGGARAATTAIGRKILQKGGTAGLAGAIGAGEGAIAGVGSGEGVGGRVAGGLVGGTLGGVVGSAAPAVIGAGSRAVNRVRTGVSDKAAEKAADVKALQALEEAGTTPEAVQQALDETAAMGVTDAMIPDVAGEATRRLARGASTVSGEGADIAVRQLDERAAQLGDEIANDVGRVLAGGKSGADALDEILERQSSAASGDYTRAFFKDAEGTVPRYLDLKDFEDVVDTDAFKKAYNKARRIASNANSQLPPLADVQASAKRRPMEILAELDDYMQKNLMDGQQGQIDRAVNDPEYRAQLIKANPKYKRAIELYEESRKNVELTQQQGHFIKLGMDASIDTGRRSGSLSNVEQGQTKKIRGTIKDILNKNDDYRVANEKFAGDMALRDALETGEKFTTGDIAEIKKKVAGMSESEKEAFRIGVAQSVRNTANNTADMADVGRRIFNTPAKREALRVAFPDDASFEAFEKRMAARAEQVATRNTASPKSGSQTALREQDVQNLQSTADAVSSMLMGNPIPAATGIVGRVTNRASTSGKVGSALSRDLFSTDPNAQREFLDRLIARRAAEQQRIRNVSRLAGGYGGLTGGFTGLLTGER